MLIVDKLTVLILSVTHNDFIEAIYSQLNNKVKCQIQYTKYPA